MVMPGTSETQVITPRLVANVLEVERRAGDAAVLFVHGNISSSMLWQDVMVALPDHLRPVAADLRGFGRSEPVGRCSPWDAG